jgi:hypothetical protein
MAAGSGEVFNPHSQLKETAMGWLAALNEKLIDDWRSQILNFWTVRIALFWGGVSGLLVLSGPRSLRLFLFGFSPASQSS